MSSQGSSGPAPVYKRIILSLHKAADGLLKKTHCALESGAGVGERTCTLETEGSACEPGLCHLLAVGPRASYLISLCFSFLVCKTGDLVRPPDRAVVKIK